MVSVIYPRARENTTHSLVDALRHTHDRNAFVDCMDLVSLSSLDQPPPNFWEWFILTNRWIDVSFYLFCVFACVWFSFRFLPTHKQTNKQTNIDIVLYCTTYYAILIVAQGLFGSRTIAADLHAGIQVRQGRQAKRVRLSQETKRWSDHGRYL